MSVVITVPYDVAQCSENYLPRQLQARARVIKEAREIGYLYWLAAGRPQFQEKVRVSVVVRRGDALDEGPNLTGALKAVADGVFVGLESYGPEWDERQRRIVTKKHRKVAMLRDDRPECLAWGPVVQEIDRRYRGREEVVFTVEPVTSDE